MRERFFGPGRGAGRAESCDKKLKNDDKLKIKNQKKIYHHHHIKNLKLYLEIKFISLIQTVIQLDVISVF